MSCADSQQHSHDEPAREVPGDHRAWWCCERPLVSKLKPTQQLVCKPTPDLVNRPRPAGKPSSASAGMARKDVCLGKGVSKIL
jgi:hypothetical protein